ncbi:Uncharacterised protein [Mycobacteroides abscessus subsp. abscessus]|nr:Uncharacterised protein [Mycobacteroides abscessus subsp. abscessus]
MSDCNARRSVYSTAIPAILGNRGHPMNRSICVPNHEANRVGTAFSAME